MSHWIDPLVLLFTFSLFYTFVQAFDYFINLCFLNCSTYKHYLMVFRYYMGQLLAITKETAFAKCLNPFLYHLYFSSCADCFEISFSNQLFFPRYDPLIASTKSSRILHNCNLQYFQTLYFWILHHYLIIINLNCTLNC